MIPAAEVVDLSKVTICINCTISFSICTPYVGAIGYVSYHGDSLCNDWP